MPGQVVINLKGEHCHGCGYYESAVLRQESCLLSCLHTVGGGNTGTGRTELRTLVTYYQQHPLPSYRHAPFPVLFDSGVKSNQWCKVVCVFLYYANLGPWPRTLRAPKL